MQKKLKNFIKWALITDMVLMSALFLKLFCNPWERPLIAQAASNDLVLGASTEHFIQGMNNAGINAIARGKIKRPGFSVVGRTVTLGNDSMQVYEYPDHESAAKDAQALDDKYAHSRHADIWKSQLHMNAYGNILTFYVGTQAPIVSAIDTVESQPAI